MVFRLRDWRFIRAACGRTCGSQEPRRRISSGIESSRQRVVFLYLCHFPFLAFLWLIGLAPRQFDPNATGYVWFFACLAAALVYAFLIWWLFERNTNALRRWIEELTLLMWRGKGKNAPLPEPDSRVTPPRAPP